MNALKSALFAGTAMLIALGGTFAPAHAQAPGATTTRPAGPLYDPQQLPAFKGQVKSLTLSPRGDIDGLILADGTEVKSGPSMSTELAATVKPGATVTIHGLKAAALPLIQASSITEDASGKTVVDIGRGGPRRGRRPGADFGAASHLTEAQGAVRMALHGPRGEVNGALLEDGTVLRLPPREATRLAAMLQPGQAVLAVGDGVGNSLGKTLRVSQIGPSRDKLTEVQSGGPGGKRAPRHAAPGEGAPRN